MSDIRNIIFDLGEVIIDVDPFSTITAFEELGCSAIRELYHNSSTHSLFHDFETGHADAVSFRQKLCKLLDQPLDDSDVDKAWKAMLQGIPAARLQRLEELNSKYRIFLLSNTNELHVEAIHEYLRTHHKRDAFNGLFKREYYSCFHGLRKPDPAIFNLILEENNLESSETLFLDDVEENLESAHSLGIQTRLVSRENDMLKILKDF